MTTVADTIARRLAAEGCRHAFGVPGGEVLNLIEALRAAGIKVHLARHENFAGFMAEGVHHFDGAPAILFATIGPGIANAVNVIANAMQDRVPMVALTGSVGARDRHTYTHQVFDHVKLFEEVTKAAFRVDAGSAAVIADKAVAIATQERPGPVLLDVPMDVQGSEEDYGYAGRSGLAHMTPAEGPALIKARQWWCEAKRPLVIAGVDTLNQHGEMAVANFCLRHGAPLITTYKAKGILPEDNPLALGGAGLSPRVDKVLLPVVEAADCIILAGYDPIEMRTGWRNPWGPEKRVIEFSAAPNTHYMHQARLNFIGDIAAGLTTLEAEGGPAETWPEKELADIRSALRNLHDRAENWGPVAIIDEARKALPRETVATVDSGAHRIVLSQVWECFEPRGLLQSSALCTMGAAVPIAAGRKMAEPDRPVVAFVGDAGLEMFLGDLATIRDMELSLPIVVFVDESLALIELKQRNSQLPNLAVDFGGTDFPAIAEALGGRGVWVDDRAGLRRALKAALGFEGLTLIAARIGRRAYDGRI